MAKSKPQLSFYRPKSALQFNFVPPIFTQSGQIKYFSKHGFVVLNGALGENKVMDWSKKIAFALGIGDLPHMLHELHRWKFSKSKKISIILNHDPKAKSEDAGKTFKKFTINNGSREGTYELKISSTDAEKPFYIYLNEGEMLMLHSLIEAMPAYMLGLDKQEERYESLN